MASVDLQAPEDVQPPSLTSSPVQHQDDIDAAFDSLILIESIYQKKGFEQVWQFDQLRYSSYITCTFYKSTLN